MTICAVGTGYVGLVTGAVVADLGHELGRVDTLPDRIASVRDGHSIGRRPVRLA